jgi:hypothetical protein
MKRISTTVSVAALSGLMCIAVDGNSASATVVSLEAVDNATVQAAGPRPGAAGKNFFNMQGSANNQFASFGVADFDLGAVPPLGFTATDVTNVTLSLTQANAGFSAPGDVSVFLTDKTGVNIQPGSSIAFQAGNNGAAAVDSAFNPLTLLGTGNFGTTGNVNSGTVDVYNLSFSGTGLDYLLTQLNTGGTLRLVLATTAAGTSATYAGFSNSNFDGPTLSFTAIPEPASLALLGLGSLLIAGRRRQRA